MRKTDRLAILALVVGIFGAAALGDGMIVPVRPDLRVRGHWAVKYHHVKMIVRDQVASVTIDQEFVNTGREMIEVEYLFPVPPETAIDAMTLVVNGREFAARLLNADEARRIYQDIVRHKKDPALLEYAGFGLYRTRAFPLAPGEPAKVVVHYESVCRKDRDLVEVWYPLNTEKFSAKPIEDIQVVVDLKCAADILAVYSPTHDLTVDRRNSRHVIATYHDTNALPATDIQVFYRAADEEIGATLLTYRPAGDKDGYFLMLASPNPRLARTKVAPKDVVIVFDHSGSMSGQKIDQVKQAVRFILDNLNADDRFNVIAYSDIVEPFFETSETSEKLVSPEKDKLDEARDRLDRIDARGGTNIHEALLTAMQMAGAKRLAGNDPSRPAYVIFMTDGLPTVGKTNEKTILADVKAANDAAARLFAFGVGYDVNIRLLDKLVADNNGRSDYVKPKENIETKISSLYAKIRNPVMTDIKVEVDGVRLRDVYPRQIGDLFEGDQLVLAGRYEGHGDKTLVVSGTCQGKGRAFEYPVTFGDKRDSRFAFVERIWAVRRVGYLMDQIQLNGESKEVIDELVKLSKQYGIITPYTSFLADESTKLADEGELREHMAVAAKSLASDVAGYEGQRAAMARQQLGRYLRAPAAGAPGSAVYGNIAREAYEAGKVETVANVRQVGNQAMYRRGQAWVAANASHIDLKRDADKIKDIERFSDEYFRLAAANSVQENQVLASQAEGEEIIIDLRGQVYRIR